MTLFYILCLFLLNFTHSKISSKSLIKYEETVPLKFIYSNKKSKNIYLNNSNLIMLKGEINKKNTNQFLYDLNLNHNKKNIFIYIDSPGGSVEEGNKIIREVQYYNLKCIAEKAYSMAFAIFQSCKYRYIIPFSKLMQHQISLGIQNEKGKIENYMQFINQIENELVLIQSSKLNMNPDEFKLKTLNEWWIFGKEILKENCADKMIMVFCSPYLTKQNITVQTSYYEYVYSKCPLINEPIEKIKIKEQNIFDIFL